MKAIIQRFNLILRVTMELGIVLAIGYWEFHSGKSEAVQIILGIGSPILIFGFWGFVDFHNASKAEFLRLIQELILSGIAVAALFIAGQPVLGFIFAGLSIIHHSLVYILGDTLIKKK